MKVSKGVLLVSVWVLTGCDVFEPKFVAWEGEPQTVKACYATNYLMTGRYAVVETEQTIYTLSDAFLFCHPIMSGNARVASFSWDKRLCRSGECRPIVNQVAR